LARILWFRRVNLAAEQAEQAVEEAREALVEVAVLGAQEA